MYLNKNYSNQIVRCSGFVGANYRAACRAKSKADFINKLKILEVDESMFFLELINEFNPAKKETITVLWKEANELLSIIVVLLTTFRKSLVQS
jgi:four helix bundle protein